jgi:hypothetical protein
MSGALTHEQCAQKTYFNAVHALGVLRHVKN